MGAVDVPALLVAIVASAAIVAALAFFANRGTRRDWMVAGAVALVVFVIGMSDLLRESPRETHWATWLFGATLPVAGTLAMIRATHWIAKPWQRWPLVFLITFVLLFLGLFLGASMLPRFLPG